MELLHTLIILIASIIGGYVTSFFQQRAKNRADLLTVELLTQKVEEIKSTLSVMTQNKLKFDNEKYAALLAFHVALRTFGDYLISISIPTLKNATIENYDLEHQQIKGFWAELMKAKGVLLLFYSEHTELNEKIKLVAEPLIDLQGKILACLLDIFHIQSELREKTTESVEKNIQSQLGRLQTFLDERAELYQIIHPRMNDVTECISKEMWKILVH